MNEVDEMLNWLFDEAMPVTDRLALPVFETVRVLEVDWFTSTLPKDRFVEDNAISGADVVGGDGVVPSPDRVICRLPWSESLLVTVRVPDLLPAEEGVKVTVTVWAPPAATV